MLRFGRDRRVPQEEGDPALVHAKYQVSKKPHSVILITGCGLITDFLSYALIALTAVAPRPTSRISGRAYIVMLNRDIAIMPITAYPIRLRIAPAILPPMRKMSPVNMKNR